MYSPKNYTAHGGAETIIGGTVRVLSTGKIQLDEGAIIEGMKFAEAGNVPVMENQSASAASTIAALREDLNALLEKLKATGLMMPDEKDGE